MWPTSSWSLFFTVPITNLTSQTYCGNSIPLPYDNLATDLDMSTMLLATFHSFKESRYGAYMFYFDNNSQFKNFTIFFNTTATHGTSLSFTLSFHFFAPHSTLIWTYLAVLCTSSFPIALPVMWNQYVNMLFSQKLPAVPSAHIETKLDPMPLTANQKALRSSIIGLLISIGFAFVPASIAAWIVKERSLKAKHQQIISGEGFNNWIDWLFSDVFYCHCLLLSISILLFVRCQYSGLLDFQFRMGHNEFLDSWLVVFDHAGHL